MAKLTDCECQDEALAPLAPADGPLAQRWQHPPSFYCPIAHQCMRDPVVLADGHSYERRHIERWLQDHNTSPVSGLQLQQTDVFPNHALRNAIEEYFQQVFSAHRRAIRRTMDAPAGAVAGVPLLHAIDALMQCSLLMGADLDIECVLKQIMEEAKTLLGAEAASVFLLDAERQELYSTVNSTGREIRIPVRTGIAGCVARSGEPVLVPDAYGDGRFDRMVDVKTGFRTRNIMCVPLKDRKGGVMGVAQLINKTGSGTLGANQTGASKAFGWGVSPASKSAPPGDSFTADDQQFLMVFASQAASAIASSGTFTMPKAYAPGPAAGTLSSAPGEQDGRLKSMEESPKKLLHQSDEHSIAANELLAQASASWHFDAFSLAKVTANRPLSALSVHLFSRLGLVDKFCLNGAKLCRFFEEIERGYDDSNPYHNRAHAASVLHAMHALLEHGGLMKVVAPSFGGADGCGSKCDDCMSCADLERMACLIAAAVHDYEHTGLSNDFLVKTGHERAIRYNDEHVNENHHVAAAFNLLLRPELNFLEHLPAEDFRRLRKLVIDLVLGTDMAHHGKILQSAREMLSTCSGDVDAVVAQAAFKPASDKEAVLLLQLAMKCADLGHLAQEWELHSHWVRCLEEEFFLQGDKEKDAGLPLSFLMDRGKPGASATQVGFFSAVVLPLFGELAHMAPGAAPLLASAEANCLQWKALESPAASPPADACQRTRKRRAMWRPQPAEHEALLTSIAADASGGDASGQRRRGGRARRSLRRCVE